MSQISRVPGRPVWHPVSRTISSTSCSYLSPLRLCYKVAL
jgi:hypothetical protein